MIFKSFASFHLKRGEGVSNSPIVAQIILCQRSRNLRLYLNFYIQLSRSVRCRNADFAGLVNIGDPDSRYGLGTARKTNHIVTEIQFPQFRKRSYNFGNYRQRVVAQYKGLKSHTLLYSINTHCRGRWVGWVVLVIQPRGYFTFTFVGIKTEKC